MLPATNSVESARLVIDHAAHSIKFERRFNASPAQIFEAWTKPEEVSRWWGPSGEPLAICEIDLREGGAFNFVSKSHPDRPFTGTYLEIVPFERLSFNALGAIGHVSLDKCAGQTRLTLEIQCRSAEHLQQFLQSGMHEGTSRTLDNLVSYIGAQSR